LFYQFYQKVGVKIKYLDKLIDKFISSIRKDKYKNFKTFSNNTEIICPICGKQLIWDYELKDETEPNEQLETFYYKCRGCDYRKEIKQ